MCKGKTEEGKSRCKVRLTNKSKKFSVEGFAGLIPDYEYVKGDSLSKKCYDRLRKQKNASQEYCVCQGRRIRTTDGEAKCGSRVKLSEDDSSYSADGFEETIQARDSGYKYVEGDLLFSTCKARLGEEKQRMQASARMKRQRQAERERTEREQSNMKYDLTSTERPKVAQLANRDQDAKVAMAAAWFMADIDDEDSPREMTELSPAEQQRILGRFQGELNNHMRIHTCGVSHQCWRTGWICST